MVWTIAFYVALAMMLLEGLILISMGREKIAFIARQRVLEEQIRQLAEGKTRADSETPPTKPEKTPGEDIMQGLVTKAGVVSAGRKSTNYTVTDRMPRFTSIEAAVGWGHGLCTQMEDPTKINIAGYGALMSIDNYIGLKLVMSNLLDQIENLHHRNPPTNEGTTGYTPEV
jgi:hypothetical protein